MPPHHSNISEVKTYRLHADKFDQAYPLVRELNSTLTLEDWRIYAENSSNAAAEEFGPQGFIAAEHRGCIRGLLRYDVLIDLVEVATLAVRDVIVLGIPAGQPVARGLLHQLFAVAGANQCDAIRIDLNESMAWLAREWSDPQGTVFRFPVFCFLPGATLPAPPGDSWSTPPLRTSTTGG